MTLDILFLAIFLLLTFLGWRSGVLRQIVRVVAAIVVLIGTAPLSGLVRDIFFGTGAGPVSPGLEIASMFLTAILLYIGISIAGWFAIKILHLASDTISRADAISGALVGACKALIIVYIGGVLALTAQGMLAGVDPDDRMHLRDGRLTAFVHEHNIIAPWRFPDLERFHAALRVAQFAESKRGANELRTRATVADFLRRDDFKELSGLPELREFAQTNQYPMTLAREDVRALLQDEDFSKALGAIDWVVLEKDLGLLVTSAEGDAK